MNKRQTLTIATGLLCAFLAGCGGGDDNSSPAQPSSTRADFGAWQTTTGGYTYAFMVGNTGETWGYQINQGASGLFLYHGQQAINGSSVSGSYLSYNLTGTPAAPASVSYTGTAQAQSYLNLTLSSGGMLNYPYLPVVAQTGTLANFQGAWAGSLYNNLPGNTYFPSTITVSGSSVSFPAAGSSGCQVTGTLAPQSTFISDAGDYLFSGQFSLQCGVQGGVQVGGAAITGLMIYDPSSVIGGTQNMVMLYAVTTDQRVGMMFIGYQ
jgi:hypothetical protein